MHAQALGGTLERAAPQTGLKRKNLVDAAEANVPVVEPVFALELEKDVFAEKCGAASAESAPRDDRLEHRLFEIKSEERGEIIGEKKGEIRNQVGELCTRNRQPSKYKKENAEENSYTLIRFGKTVASPLLADTREHSPSECV